MCKNEIENEKVIAILNEAMDKETTFPNTDLEENLRDMVEYMNRLLDSVEERNFLCIMKTSLKNTIAQRGAILNILDRMKSYPDKLSTYITVFPQNIFDKMNKETLDSTLHEIKNLEAAIGKEKMKPFYVAYSFLPKALEELNSGIHIKGEVKYIIKDSKLVE